MLLPSIVYKDKDIKSLELGTTVCEVLIRGCTRSTNHESVSAVNHDLSISTQQIKTNKKTDRWTLLIPNWEIVVLQQHVKGFALRAKNKRLNGKLQ